MGPDPGQPRDLLAPQDPIVILRRRPVTVTLACGLLVAGAVVGAVSALAFVVGAVVVAEGFQLTAARTDADPAQIEDVAGVIRVVLAGSGVVAVILAAGMGVCAVGVLRGSRGSRTGVLSLVAVSVCFGLGSASYTTLGRGVDWTATLPGGSATLRAQIGEAYGDATPALLVGATGGLTDLQVLSYIAGAALLVAPASRPHFRRRSPPAGRSPTPPAST
jgi:hypothetical protein